MSLDVEGERILDAVVDGIAEEFMAELRKNPHDVQSSLPSWTRFRNPFTGEPFVSEGTILKTLSLVREGIHRLPKSAKERIAIRALKGNTQIAESYATSFVRGTPQKLTEGILEQSGFIIPYKPYKGE